VDDEVDTRSSHALSLSLSLAYRMARLKANVVDLGIVCDHLRLDLLCLNVPDGTCGVDAARANDTALTHTHTDQSGSHSWFGSLPAYFGLNSFQSNDVNGAQNLNSAFLFCRTTPIPNDIHQSYSTSSATSSERERHHHHHRTIIIRYRADTWAWSCHGQES